MRAGIGFAIACMFPFTATAQGFLSGLELKAAKAPGSKAWELPAELSYLNSSGGESSYATNAAVSGILPNIPGTTIQSRLTAWVAKNTLLEKEQDKRGIEAAIGMAGGNEHFGYFPQISVSIDRDRVKQTHERTYEATIDFISKDLRLGGCGVARVHGCTYWDLLAGLYSNDVRSADNNLGLGRVNGGRLVLQVTSNPFAAQHPLAPLSFTALAQRQWDRSASAMREKDTRRNYVGAVAWRFYDENSKVKPSIALKRVLGADLLTGQEEQGYTQLAFRLEL